MTAQGKKRLSLSGRRWKASALVLDRQDGQPVPDWMRRLMEQRGVVGTAAIDSYLNPTLASLDDPMQMADMEVAVRRLIAAIEHREVITVYGDYDVDGVCSTAILVDFLRQVGAQASYYIPDRRTEGYGLNQAAVRALCDRARLIIATDCGITADAEIRTAAELGTDVIVVDHHQIPKTLPPAVACLDPHRPDCKFPFKDLCAAGVAFMLAGAVRRALRERGYFRQRDEPDVRNLLDLVAFATVADMVPMQGPNRALVSAGLKRIAAQERLGVRALLEVSKVEASRVTSTDIGFRLAPRINARGRLGHAADAVELLLSRDVRQAQVLAAMLDQANRRRRQVELEATEDARTQLERYSYDRDAGVVVYHPSWHPGVVGLVASRLAALYTRPCIVIGAGGKGSARSVEGLDVFAAISAASRHLQRFGGHPAAAGLTIKPAHVQAFRYDFCRAVQQRIGAPPYLATLRTDLEVAPDELNLGMVDELRRLEPFGRKNPEPVLVTHALAVRKKRVVGGSHLKLALGPRGHDAIGFNMGELVGRLPERVDVAFRLHRNVFRGRESAQLTVEDLRASDE